MVVFDYRAHLDMRLVLQLIYRKDLETLSRSCFVGSLLCMLLDGSKGLPRRLTLRVLVRITQLCLPAESYIFGRTAVNQVSDPGLLQLLVQSRLTGDLLRTHKIFILPGVGEHTLIRSLLCTARRVDLPPPGRPDIRRRKVMVFEDVFGDLARVFHQNTVNLR